MRIILICRLLYLWKISDMGRGAGSIGLGKGHQTMECVLSDHQSIGVREARCEG